MKLEKIADAINVPKEIALDMPKIYLTGNCDLLIENFKGVIQFEPDILRVNSSIGVITVKGRNLDIACISDDDLLVKGIVTSICF